MHVLNSNKNLTKEQNCKLTRNEFTHFPSNFQVQWATVVTSSREHSLSASTSTLVFFTAQSLHTHSHTKSATCTSLYLYLLQSSKRSTLPLTLISAHVFVDYFTKAHWKPIPFFSTRFFLISTFLFWFFFSFRRRRRGFHTLS